MHAKTPRGIHPVIPIIMASVPLNDPNVDTSAIVPAPANPEHAPAQPEEEEDPEEEEEDLKEEEEDRGRTEKDIEEGSGSGSGKRTRRGSGLERCTEEGDDEESDGVDDVENYFKSYLHQSSHYQKFLSLAELSWRMMDDVIASACKTPNL
ncbi:hypothetical protein Tco_0894923 [Tanacetum coccineum]|uniref:Uncharacterized protein n=1 Tax=Tanacetum coccineum TaxID=301880 RepID=A0ABQ5CD53_9ASTR